MESLNSSPIPVTELEQSSTTKQYAIGTEHQLEFEKLRLERFKARLDYRKFVLGSFFAAIAIAAIPPLFQYATANLEHVKSQKELEVKQQTFRDEYIKEFLSNALNQDIELRIRFAQYFARVATEQSRKDWVDYLSDLTHKRDDIRAMIDKDEYDWRTKMSAPNRDVAEIDRLERHLAWAYKEVGYLEPNRSSAVNPRSPEGFHPKDALDLLEGMEGINLKPYKGIDGDDYIGAGHQITDSEFEKGTIRIGGKEVPFKEGLSAEQVKLLLEQEIKDIRLEINRLVTVKLTSEQLDALASFLHQVGPEMFKRSTLLRKLNAGLFEQVPFEMRRWVKINGKTIPGAIFRREAEISLWAKSPQ
ncbi:MAG: lysozyme [Methylococcales bacterium]